MAPELRFFTASTISKETFHTVLSQAKSPAANDADTLYEIPVRYRINPAIALAFFKHESSCGTAGVARSTLNWGNLRRSRGHAAAVHDGWAWYHEWRDSLEDWCLLIKEYADRGLDTVEEAIPVYAPSSDNNAPARYIAFVVAAVKQWQEIPTVPTPDAFHVDIRHWANAAALAEHLSHYDPSIAAWAKGVTVHHTDVPTPAQWRGLRSLQGDDGKHGLVQFYKDKGWDGGPHLFACIGAPNPADDGLWQMTPLNMPGIHAGICNKDHWSIEVVGNYDKSAWPAPVADLVYGAAAALLNWRDLGPVINGHRECLPNKTCPGKAIQMDAVRAELARRMQSGTATVAGNGIRRYRVTANSVRVRALASNAKDIQIIGVKNTGALVDGVAVDGVLDGKPAKWLQISGGYILAEYAEPV
jgi:hypothetical protein